MAAVHTRPAASAASPPARTRGTPDPEALAKRSCCVYAPPKRGKEAPMKRILAVLWGDDDGDVVLGSAFEVARLFGSRVVGIYVRPPAGEFIPSGDFGMALSQDYLDRLHRESAAKAARLRAAFQETASRLGIKPGDVGA